MPIGIAVTRRQKLCSAGVPPLNDLFVFRVVCVLNPFCKFVYFRILVAEFVFLLIPQTSICNFCGLTSLISDTRL